MRRRRLLRLGGERRQPPVRRPPRRPRLDPRRRLRPRELRREGLHLEPEQVPLARGAESLRSRSPRREIVWVSSRVRVDVDSPSADDVSRRRRRPIRRRRRPGPRSLLCERSPPRSRPRLEPRRKEERNRSRKQPPKGSTSLQRFQTKTRVRGLDRRRPPRWRSFARKRRNRAAASRTLIRRRRPRRASSSFRRGRPTRRRRRRSGWRRWSPGCF